MLRLLTYSRPDRSAEKNMIQSRPRPEDGTNGEADVRYYYVVCRDCQVVSLETGEKEARDVASRHDEETGHDVTVSL